MASTLSLRKDEAPAPAAPVPIEFDVTQHYGEVWGMDPARFIQGKYLFDNGHNFMKEAPQNMWLAPLTAKQESDRQDRFRKNKQFFAAARPKANEAGIPQNVINAERENAQARAAETQAA